MEGKGLSKYYVALLVALLFHEITRSHAQVTFSRDWRNPGKRSLNNNDCAISMRSAVSVCELLVAELRMTAGCEARALLAERLSEDSPLPPPGLFQAEHHG